MELDLNRKFVKSKRPCADGFRWFIRHYEQGGDYQELLDALVEDDRIGDACWLLDQFGPTDAVRVVDAIDAKAVVFAGTLKVLGSVQVDQLVRTGRQLHVGASVRAGFESDPGMQAGIVCGEDVRIVGGLNVKGDVLVKGDLRAGWGVLVEGDVRCEGEFQAGWELECSGTVAVAGNLKPGRQLLVQESLRCDKSIHVQGPIEVRGPLHAGHGVISDADILCGLHLDVGWGVRAQGRIVVEGSIRAGEGICAGEDILTGQGYGVHAGLSVHQDSWQTSARVQAASRPDNLMSGYWFTTQDGQKE